MLDLGGRASDSTLAVEALDEARSHDLRHYLVGAMVAGGHPRRRHCAASAVHVIGARKGERTAHNRRCYGGAVLRLLSDANAQRR